MHTHVQAQSVHRVYTAAFCSKIAIRNVTMQQKQQSLTYGINIM